MSVEDKIQKLLNRKGEQLTEASTGDATAPMQGSSQKASFTTIADTNAKPSVTTAKDSSKSASAATAGHTTQPRQGDSKDAPAEDLDKDAPGKTASAKASKDSTMSAKMSGDASQPMQGDSKKATYTEDLDSQLNSIFGEELSEEFRSKATSIFEAAVIARVNAEMENVTARLEEQNQIELNEFKETIVEKVDGYLNYIVEQWMEENQLAVETGLRTEITEQFIAGLKNLFVESYIEVPEEKFDVVDNLASEVDELSAKLNESVEENIAIKQQFVELSKKVILEQETKELASTEAEKLQKLVEGIDFESEELYREKINVIKESYFPKTAINSPEKTLVEETGTNPTLVTGQMNKYVEALSRAARAR